MTRSKKVFVGIALVFLVALVYASYDISTRTTFPGSKSQLKERIRQKFSENDSIGQNPANRGVDSTKNQK